MWVDCTARSCDVSVLVFARLAAAGFACVDLCCFTTGVLMFGVAAAGGTGAGSCMAGVS